MTRQCYCCAENVTSRSEPSCWLICISTNLFVFQLISNSASIDRKVRFHIPPKSNVAIKILRNHLGTLLAQLFRGKPLSDSQGLWFKLALMVLGKEKIVGEVEGHLPVVVIN
jgi:hypothetical protein